MARGKIILFIRSNEYVCHETYRIEAVYLNDVLMATVQVHCIYKNIYRKSLIKKYLLSLIFYIYERMKETRESFLSL